MGKELELPFCQIYEIGVFPGITHFESHEKIYLKSKNKNKKMACKTHSKSYGLMTNILRILNKLRILALH